jgi:hypothetical protein
MMGADLLALAIGAAVIAHRHLEQVDTARGDPTQDLGVLLPPGASQLGRFNELATV